MKHLLNNLSSEEKNSIREQHAGGMKVMTENFSRLLNAKSGEVKPLVNEEENDDDVVMLQESFRFYRESVFAYLEACYLSRKEVLR